MAGFSEMNVFELPEDWRRQTMGYCICAGMINMEIANKLHFPMMTLHFPKKRLEDINYDVEAIVAIKDHDKDVKRPSFRRSREFIDTIQKRVQENPSISMRALERELLLVKSKLLCKSTCAARAEGKLLTAKVLENHKKKARKLFNQLKHLVRMI
ncbi:Hypothetical protein FKW44_021287 [Caligus rogercresseyi]|uniref:Uncharacterized protein n=1 Tax=Caligus rogercresseyi TaxID=217165 RepID=A0A7T8GRM7_CALRO|nr:Hypothetical protein FKW44_021287 [Caligus rogercresseyi]